MKAKLPKILIVAVTLALTAGGVASAAHHTQKDQPKDHKTFHNISSQSPELPPNIPSSPEPTPTTPDLPKGETPTTPPTSTPTASTPTTTDTAPSTPASDIQAPAAFTTNWGKSGE